MILQTAHPTRIILLGSKARDQTSPHSDVDLLVVMPDGIHRLETAKKIYRALSGMELPIYRKDAFMVKINVGLLSDFALVSIRVDDHD